MLHTDAVNLGDQRSLYYYARELYYAERYSDAIEVFTAATTATRSWKAQTAMSYAFLGECYSEMNNSELALPSFYNAALHNPMHPDHWFDLGYFYYSIGQYHLAIGYCTRALLLKQDGLATTDYVITDLSKTGWQAHDVLATCYYQINDLKNYMVHCATAYKLNPSNERILSNFNDMVAQHGINEDENTTSTT